MLSRSLPLSSRMRPRPSLRISPPSDGRSKFVIQRFNKSRSLSLSLSLSPSLSQSVLLLTVAGQPEMLCSVLLCSAQAGLLPSFLPSFSPPLILLFSSVLGRAAASFLRSSFRPCFPLPLSLLLSAFAREHQKELESRATRLHWS